MATVQIPIPLDTPDATGKAYPALSTGNGFSNVRQLVPAFVKDVDGSWTGRIRVPQDFASTAKIILSLVANATSGATRMLVSTSAVADGESEDPAYTDEAAQDVTVPATAKLRKDVTFTLTPTVAAGDTLNVKVTHNGIHANDTLAVDTLLWECLFQY